MGLAGLLFERWERVEADFERFYGRDLRVCVWGPPEEQLGVRRLSALVEHLPPDAAVWRQEVPWSTQDELLATLVERHDEWAQALFGALTRAKRVRTPGVVRFPRPGEVERKPVETDPKRIEAFFRAHFKT